jgi:hypothetical protein
MSRAVRGGGFPPKTCSRSASRVGSSRHPGPLPGRMRTLKPHPGGVTGVSRSRIRRGGFRCHGEGCAPRGARHQGENQRSRCLGGPGAGENSAAPSVRLQRPRRRQLPLKSRSFWGQAVQRACAPGRWPARWPGGPSMDWTLAGRRMPPDDRRGGAGSRRLS